MLSIQPWRRRQRDKELTTIGILAGIRHAQHARTRVPEPWVNLVGKRAAPARLAAAPGAGWVTALDHKGWDDAVEDRVVVVAALHQCGEVGAGFGRVGRVELERDEAL